MSIGFILFVIVEALAALTLAFAILREDVLIRAENRFVEILSQALRSRKKARALRRREKMNAKVRFTPEIPPCAA